MDSLARLLPSPAAGAPPHPRPQPIVLDTHLKTPLSCKLLVNYDKGKGTGRQPVIIAGHPNEKQRIEWDSRKHALETEGAMVRSVSVASDGRGEIL